GLAYLENRGMRLNLLGHDHAIFLHSSQKGGNLDRPLDQAQQRRVGNGVFAVAHADLARLSASARGRNIDPPGQGRGMRRGYVRVRGAPLLTLLSRSGTAIVRERRAMPY